MDNQSKNLLFLLFGCLAATSGSLASASCGDDRNTSVDGTGAEPHVSPGTAGQSAGAPPTAAASVSAGASGAPPQSRTGAAGTRAEAGAGVGTAGQGIAGAAPAAGMTGGMAGFSSAGQGAAGGAGTSGASAAGAGSEATPPMLGPEDLIAAPDGNEGAPGTLDEPTTLAAAITRVAAGGSIYLRGGDYRFAKTLNIGSDTSGTSDMPKTISAYAAEEPVLDFSAQPRSGSNGNPRGIQLTGDYWHLVRLTVQNAADNGIIVGGSNNVIEGCIIRGNGDTGLQISQTGSSSRPANNLILNCESYDNDDPLGENADGFAAKLTAGPGNMFRGCVSHHNADDGWDLWTNAGSPIDPVTIDQCIAHHNGTLTDGTTRSNGDRNGFKLGGASVAVSHIVTRSIAFANGAVGFTWNSNPGAITMSNNLSFDNASANFYFGNSSRAIYTNNISFRTSPSGRDDSIAGDDVSGSNCWWMGSKSACGNGLSVGAEDFAAALDAPRIERHSDGSLDLTAFALAAGSDLVNAGVTPSAKLPFEASYFRDAPDLGAVEQ